MLVALHYQPFVPNFSALVISPSNAPFKILFPLKESEASSLAARLVAFVSRYCLFCDSLFTVPADRQ
jgi:hypothetical protein